VRLEHQSARSRITEDRLSVEGKLDGRAVAELDRVRSSIALRVADAIVRRGLNLIACKDVGSSVLKIGCANDLAKQTADLLTERGHLGRGQRPIRALGCILNCGRERITGGRKRAVYAIQPRLGCSRQGNVVGNGRLLLAEEFADSEGYRIIGGAIGALSCCQLPVAPPAIARSRSNCRGRK